MTSDTLVFSTKEHDRKAVARNETLFTTANGYLGLRGNYDEKSGCVHRGTYINGFYDTEPITYGETAFAYAKNHETILNLPDPTCMELTADGTAFSTEESVEHAVTDFSMVLDFKEGCMKRFVSCRDKNGNAYSVNVERIVSFKRKTCAVIRFEITAQEIKAGSETIDFELKSFIDTSATNLSAKEDPRVGAKFSSRPLIIKEKTADVSSDKLSLFQFKGVTRNSGKAIAGTVLNCVENIESKVIEPESTEVNADGNPISTWNVSLKKGESVIFTKYISYEIESFTEQNESFILNALSDKSIGNVRSVFNDGLPVVKCEQKKFLDEFWKTAYMHIAGSLEDERAVNFNLFHLLQSACRDGKASIAAKGLTAEGYEGHFFWDTEAYVCPVFIYLKPQIAASLLSYRNSILPLAKERAAEMNLKGALFPWRTISGHETSAYYPAGTAQYHINADIMFALNRYLEACGFYDGVKLNDVSGGTLTDEAVYELAAETARMWISLGSYIPSKGNKFCINEVTGPDEYTACVNNNAFTNLMAQENLRISERIVDECEKRGITKGKAASADEKKEWLKAADNMYIPYDASEGIYPQDDSFMEKADWDFANTPKENYPLLLHYHPLVIYRHRVLKQPDLVLAQILLSGEFNRAEKIRNFLFYEKYTTGDSSLSHSIQCIAACEIPDVPKALKYFNKTARMDIADVQGNTRDGIHTAGMAGSWMAIVYGFAGFRDYGGEYKFNPQLPSDWKSLDFSLQLKGGRLQLNFSHDKALYTYEGKRNITITHRDCTFTLSKGESREFDLTRSLQAVLFDMDGVITDTAHLHFKAWKKFAENHGLTFTEEMNKAVNGRSRMDSLEAILKFNGVEWSEPQKKLGAEEKNDLYKASLVDITPENILPGIRDFLEELSANKVICVLASASENAPFILEKLGLKDYFYAIVNPRSLQKGKPQPDIYIKAADISGKWYTNCVGIEDAQSGINAIKDAGIFAVGIGKGLQNADMTLEDTASLTYNRIKTLF